MIRAIVAALFPHGSQGEYVLGFGHVTLPGALRNDRHGRLRTKPLPIVSPGKSDDVTAGPQS